ncbi:Aste57867_18352 [Aphanomyces stellatus]|uniref:Aste57867_18352 protein n=1 Tax=Aphanomyces stellatus TaxID=120398 RepID=A0A485LA76_9STRA|nr:hypothetical protein As57867_018290 [Aphanomyces stellatus]VFT95088.1 Aste57867_18352 [Aphanomyces stellatus]
MNLWRALQTQPPRRFFYQQVATASTAPAASATTTDAILERFKVNPSQATQELVQAKKAGDGSALTPAFLARVLSMLFQARHTKEATAVLRLSLDESINLDYGKVIKGYNLDAMAPWVEANAASIPTTQHIAIIRKCLAMKKYSHAARFFRLVDTRHINADALSKDVMRLLTLVEACPDVARRRNVQDKIMTFLATGDGGPALVAAIHAVRPDATALSVRWTTNKLCRKKDDVASCLSQVNAIFAAALARKVRFDESMSITVAFSQTRQQGLDPAPLVHILLAMKGLGLVDAAEPSFMSATHACQRAGHWDLALVCYEEMWTAKQQSGMTTRLYNNGLFLCHQTRNTPVAKKLLDAMMADATIVPDDATARWIRHLLTHSASQLDVAAMTKYILHVQVAERKKAPTTQGAKGPTPKKSVVQKDEPLKIEGTTAKATDGDASSCSIM